jgi:hypothetical protein
MDNEQLKSNLTSSKHWFRLIFMLLFAAVLQLASIVMWVLVITQFFFSLITGEDNQHLRRFGHSLSTYIYDVLKFLCYSSDEKPFPFADWPATTDAQSVVSDAVTAPSAAPSTVLPTTPESTDGPAGDK